MGFNSYDDYLNHAASNGQTYRLDFMKSTGPTALVAGAWHDLTYFDGEPSPSVHGERVMNGGFWGGDNDWTFTNDAYFYTLPAGGVLYHSTGSGGTDTVNQYVPCTSGTLYSTYYTIGTYAGSGNVTLSLGGTNATARSSSASFREDVLCGATSVLISGATYAPLTLSLASTVSCTLDNISVTQPYCFTPYDTTSQNGIAVGGNVSSGTKHIVDYGAWTNVGTGNASWLMVVDMLGCYPRIPLSVNAAAAMPLYNYQTLPRYKDGDGVMAFLSVSEAPGATAVSCNLQYTNERGQANRWAAGLPTSVASCITGRLLYSAPAQDYGLPFFPMYPGDGGMQYATNIMLSGNMAVGAGAIANLVLCKPLALIPLYTLNIPVERQYLTQMISMPEVKNGACLGFLFYTLQAAVAHTHALGYLDIAWGA